MPCTPFTLFLKGQLHFTGRCIFNKKAHETMSTLFDPETEIETLKSTLSKTSNKIRAWTIDEHAQLANNALLQQEAMMKKYEEDKQRLKGMITNRQLENEKAIEEKQSSIEMLRTELEKQAQDIQTITTRTQNRETEIDTLKKEINSLSEEIKATDEDKKKLEYLTKASNIFSEKLGLSFRKVHGKKMQVIFTQIDKNDPEQIYYFFLQIVNRKYIVTDPEPRIDNLEELVKELNDTNNLRQFVIKIRKKFKELAEKSAEKS